MKARAGVWVLSLALAVVPNTALCGADSSSSVARTGADNQVDEVKNELASVTRVVVEWWHKHKMGFEGYPFRPPTGDWKLWRESKELKEFQEIEGNLPYRWLASHGKATDFKWQLFLWCDQADMFTWTVLIVNDEAKIVEVTISSPVPDWLHPENLN